MTMTPEDIEQLKQLKQLVDDGVLSPEDFEVQKNLIFTSTSRSADEPRPLNPALSPTQQKMQEIDYARRLDSVRDANVRYLVGGNDWSRSSTSTSDTVLAAQRAAVWVQYLAFLFAGSGILFGIILMAYGNSDDVESAGPYVGAGVVVALNAVVLAIILYAIGKYMEARLKQGSDLQGKSQ
jgi:hypothetical protein